MKSRPLHAVIFGARVPAQHSRSARPINTPATHGVVAGAFSGFHIAFAGRGVGVLPSAGIIARSIAVDAVPNRAAARIWGNRFSGTRPLGSGTVLPPRRAKSLVGPKSSPVRFAQGPVHLSHEVSVGEVQVH